MSSEHDGMPQYDKLKWIDFNIVDDNDDDHDHKNDDGDDGGGSYDDDDDDDDNDDDDDDDDGHEKIYSVDGYIPTSSIKQIQKIKWTNQEVC